MRVLYELSETHREQLFAFYFQQWWCLERDRADVQAALAASHVAVVCDDAGELAGFARVVSDGALYAYVADVMVRPDLRGTGAGAELIKAVLAHPQLQRVAKWELSCLPEMDAFYARWGFADPAPSHTLRRHGAAAGSPHAATA